MEAIKRPMMALFFVIVTLGAFICTRYLDSSIAFMGRNSPQKSILTTQTSIQKLQSGPMTIDIPLNCSLGDQSETCPVNYYPSVIPADDTKNQSSAASCPDYFRWIHDDLWPWRETGITREMVNSSRSWNAYFRLVILDGRAYVETYKKSYQSREVFTLWGILQLLRRYPGRVPDLDLMFYCNDVPAVGKAYFGGAPEYPPPPPPPLFAYCSDDSKFDIPFPDWSFWGWPEINIKPWEALSKDLEEGNKRTPWTEREPYAYWKGTAMVAPTRMDLLKCNVSDKHDWSARIYIQDWTKEQKRGFKQSNLANQCIHRYKIYIGGRTWSVSEKYILACDSLTLLVNPNYHDFFTRSLVPLKHYWPIKDNDKCRSIEHAVDWGNSHREEAQAIGRAGSRFIQDELKMDYVYDYMFHLLSEYAKLLKYKPTVPEKAVELCSESMACSARGLEKKFMTDSLVKGPASTEPCTMPPPYDPASLHAFVERKDYAIKQVDASEKEYWQSRNKQM